MNKIISGDIRKLPGVMVGKWEYVANQMEIKAIWNISKKNKLEVSNIEWLLEKGGRRLAWKHYSSETFYQNVSAPTVVEWPPSEFPKMTLYNI